MQEFLKPTLIAGAVALVFVGVGMWGCPQYEVYSQGLKGQAELRRAEQNRQIRINEAMAEKEAAEHEAQAEIARARGVAEANRIVAEGLGGPEGYLRYLFVNNLPKISTAGGQVIYVPTEAGLPILEAGRLARD